MPSPGQTESLRTLLLIVLGVMIVTIPVIFVIVLAKVKAQRGKLRPTTKPEGEDSRESGRE